jgi:hypothetical protein
VLVEFVKFVELIESVDNAENVDNDDDDDDDDDGENSMPVNVDRPNTNTPLVAGTVNLNAGAVSGVKTNTELGCTTDRAGRDSSFRSALRLARAWRNSCLCCLRPRLVAHFAGVVLVDRPGRCTIGCTTDRAIGRRSGWPLLLSQYENVGDRVLVDRLGCPKRELGCRTIDARSVCHWFAGTSEAGIRLKGSQPLPERRLPSVR